MATSAAEKRVFKAKDLAIDFVKYNISDAKWPAGAKWEDVAKPLVEEEYSVEALALITSKEQMKAYINKEDHIIFMVIAQLQEWKSENSRRQSEHGATSNQQASPPPPAASLQLPREEILEALALYEARGDALNAKHRAAMHATDENKLLATISRCEGLTREGNPFIVVAGSSFLGKTQNAFAIRGPVMYFVMSTVRFNTDEGARPSQHIYQSVGDISNILSGNLILDLAIPEVADVPLTRATLQRMENRVLFASAGLILEILKRMPSAGGTCASFARLFHANEILKWLPATLVQVKEFVQEKFQGRPWTVVLDEIPPVSTDARSVSPMNRNIRPERLICFVRSLFRYLGAVTVMMGTDSAIANMVTAADDSRDGGSKSHFLWAVLFVSSFPKCDVDLLRHLYTAFVSEFKKLSLPQKEKTALFDFLQHQISVCRPIIGELICKFFVQTDPQFNPADALDILEHLLVYIGREIFDVKLSRLGSPHGLMAQLCMLSTGPMTVELQERLVANLFAVPNSSVASHSISIASSLFVTCHFAVVDCSATDLYLSRAPGKSSLVDASQERWTVSFRFPFEETILFMALTRRASETCLHAVSQAVGPTFQSFRTALESNGDAYHLSSSNPNVQKSTGELLEGISCACALLATHHRLTESSVEEFLSHFAAELNVDLSLEQVSRLLPPFVKTNCRIPYLIFALTEVELECLAALHFRPHIFYRPEDRAMIDLRAVKRVKVTKSRIEGGYCLAQGAICIEDKERARAISSDTIAGVLDRFSLYDEAQLCIILCAEFVKSSETAIARCDPTTQDWLSSCLLLKVSVGGLESGKFVGSVEHLKGAGRPVDARRVVVFFELGRK